MLNRIAYGVAIAGTLATLGLRLSNASDTLAFGASAVAILALAYILSVATEHLGTIVGPRIGGILNATIANVGELIIAGFLILDGKIQVVHASITGSIIGNLLLVVGLSLLVGGFRNGVQRYDAQTTGMNAASLILATIGLIVPATFAFLLGAGELTGPGDQGFSSIESVTVGVAALLVITYAAQTWFFLRSAETPPAPPPGERAEGTWSWRLSMTVLLAAVAALTYDSEALVSTLEPTVRDLGISEFFIGIILIPLIGNLAEPIVSVRLAWQNKMDFSLMTSIGSATQVALFAAPMLVFFGLLVGNPVTLVFSSLEVVSVAVAVLIVAFVALDGRSNWLEGMQLMSVYLILAIAFFFLSP
jgi:Ca2+:H+ antiporter